MVKFSATTAQSGDLNELKRILVKHKGLVKSRVDLVIPDLKRVVTMDLDAELAVNPTEGFFEDLEKSMGNRTNVQMI